MEHYDPAMSFDEDVARSYDSGLRGDEDAAVAFLAEQARGGPALELAIGTGRIALPLAAEGIQVDGIELSEPMAARLREKPGGERIGVTLGDMSEVALDGHYRLIYVVFNSLYNLPDQEAQVRCFRNVAEHLTDDGVFVVEAFTPGYLHRLRDGQYVDAEAIMVDEVRFDVGRHDPVEQILDETHVHLTRAGTKLYPIVCRYAWPSELDLMARIAGLRRTERWAGWKGEEFTATSRHHVSVYGRAG